MKDNHQKELEKIVINIGIGRLSSQPNFKDKILPEVMRDAALITGQKPMTRPAKKSLSSFKLREGTVVGLKVTLRGRRMMDFLDKINRVVLPRIRDFRGIALSSLDSGGNLSIGIRENYVFPEINPDVSKTNFGVEVTLVPRLVKGPEKVLTVYRRLGVPLKKTA